MARLPRQVSLLARGRADQIIEADRADALRTALAREWYVRVFTDHARNQLGLGQPGIEVTATETEHLAECLRAGVAYRIHGPDGAIVLNSDGPDVVPGQDNFAERHAGDHTAERQPGTLGAESGRGAGRTRCGEVRQVSAAAHVPRGQVGPHPLGGAAVLRGYR